MIKKNVKIGNITIGNGFPIVFIAGPCVIESFESALDHAKKLKVITDKIGVPFIFKASYDKANRSSITSFRGPGLTNGIKILRDIKKETGVKVLSDVHSADEINIAGEVLDIIQIPAFLSRQTDLLVKAAKTGKPVNVKKAQFMSPEEMNNVVAKLEDSGNKNILLTERGTSFGYNTLINDFRSLVIMAKTGYPVIYDATHSVQKPGALGKASGGDSEYILPLSKAAIACGVDAIFLEVHENPEKALSDGPNMLKLDKFEKFIKEILKIAEVSR
ncbi:3-deoxy-8-phosphooctulonate synthase [Candidatus Omnitrophus magneticus]|uniref:2-dehydro-3-deoxyphosphooctonate aldolase n=1 Tax=Candidatus Omnitrophus magneticus TaxID=1609969 RepID=A0A0F0CR18_9BACT|nr:3-deoxy-8-phosphooctulonate synthase [Candidatus Omnitrophus magneticus]